MLALVWTGGLALAAVRHTRSKATVAGLRASLPVNTLPLSVRNLLGDPVAGQALQECVAHGTGGGPHD